MTKSKNFEVIIIGGSYAGLSAAMALGRSLRNVLIIDSGQPCNRQTPHSHNFITQDGEKPSVILENAKAQVLKYKTVKILNGLAVSAKETSNGFSITTNSKEEFTAKKLILATGIKDIIPNIKGFSESWGISIVHCPYCHGYELRNKKTAILANGERAFHLASLVNNLTANLTILTSGKAEFKDEQIAKLRKHNIKIVETEIAEIEHKKGQIKNVIFNNGSHMALEALYTSLPFTQNSDIPLSLGCEMTDLGYIKVDLFQKTSIQNLYACGDNSSMMRSLATAVYTGTSTGAIVNSELCNDKF
ncbi:NAD(P)/FAD-dependent oxidoreductase [Flavobacterium sp. HNIBRBA15423]|uniref:NAD(P)/FAD-dependent oxidoreductase n=1 Tax=Flavobacterium sp. HNIBRBA15423 TaxID=3458683 RepID=UPI004043C5D0